MRLHRHSAEELGQQTSALRPRALAEVRERRAPHDVALIGAYRRHVLGPEGQVRPLRSLAQRWWVNAIPRSRATEPEEVAAPPATLSPREQPWIGSEPGADVMLARFHDVPHGRVGHGDPEAPIVTAPTIEKSSYVSSLPLREIKYRDLGAQRSLRDRFAQR